MAQNTLPSGIHDLFHLAESIAHGLATHGRWIGINEDVCTEFPLTVAAAREAETTFARARSAKALAAKRFADVDAEATSWLAKARLVVMLAYGSKWSESWLATGFTNRGTNVPKRIASRIQLIGRLSMFLAEHTDFEVPFAGVTAHFARELQHRIETARAAMRNATAAAIEARRHRDSAEKELRRRMRNVRLLLSVAVGPSDPRWLAFGFNRTNAHAAPRPARPLSDAEPLNISFARDIETGTPSAAVA